LILGKDRYCAIIGPTASGKTKLAIKIAKEIDAEIIGLDSRQIYKGMPIGTAQPSKQEMDGVVHHLIGFLEPWFAISAGEYSRMVFQKIEEIKKKGKIPLLCGGAGLYYRTLVNGLFEESSSNIEIREKIEEGYRKNPQLLFDRLQTIDPEYSKIVHLNNKQRLVRALEIYEITGKCPSEHFKQQKKEIIKKISLFTVYLDWERRSLNQRIVERTKNMIENGWLDETQELIKKQNSRIKSFPALNSIGYKQITSFLNKELNINELEELIIINTRQFAKRQVQWFKKEKIDLIVKMEGLRINKLSEIIHGILKS